MTLAIRLLTLSYGVISVAAAFSNVPHVLQSHSASVTGVNNRRGSALTTAASSVAHIVDSNFKDVLGRNDKAVLVGACATWCGPCKLIEPILDKCAEKWCNELELVRFDVESENPGVKMELVMQKVLPRKLPSLVLFNKGKAVAKRSGIISEEELDLFLEMHLRVSTPKKKSGAGFVSFARDSSEDYMLRGP